MTDSRSGCCRRAGRFSSCSTPFSRTRCIRCIRCSDVTTSANKPLRSYTFTHCLRCIMFLSCLLTVADLLARLCINFWATVYKTIRPILSDRCLSVLYVTVYCGQTAGWIRMPVGMEVGIGPGHIVLHGDPALPLRKGHSSPTFLPMPFVAKRSPISATAELVWYIWHWFLLATLIFNRLFLVRLRLLAGHFSPFDTTVVEAPRLHPRQLFAFPCSNTLMTRSLLHHATYARILRSWNHASGPYARCCHNGLRHNSVKSETALFHF